jgi:Fe-S cluster assembly protein SufD
MNFDLKSKLDEKFTEFEHRLNGQKTSLFHQIRRQAFDYFKTSGFPAPKHEEWKYTNLSFINKHDFNLYLQPSTLDSSITSDEIKPFLLKNIKENLLVFVNGFFSSDLSSIKDSKEKLIIGSLSDIINSNAPHLDKHFSKHVLFDNSPFTAINTAFTQDGAYIYIPEGVTLEKPIHILQITDSRQGPIISNPRNLIILGRCANVKIFESAHTFGSSPGFTNSVSEIVLNFASQLEYYKIQNNSTNSYYIGTTQIDQEENSVFNAVTVTLRGNFIRNNLNALLKSENCETNFNGFYYLDGSSFVDNHTLADHAKPNCQSNETYKGILDNNSTAVFNGKVIVRPQAQKTNAYQSNRNILLSDDAKINTKPQLEIFADDVKCSHGATSGYLDQESLFYLRARGIGEEAAKSLLLIAFAGEIIEKIKIDELRDEVKRQVAERLNVDDIFFCDVLDNIKE